MPNNKAFPKSPLLTNSDEKIKKAIIGELSKGERLWIRELERRLNVRKIFASTYRISKIIDELEKENKVSIEWMGLNKVASLSDKK